MLYASALLKTLFIILNLSLPVTIPLLVLYDKNKSQKRKEMLLEAASDSDSDIQGAAPDNVQETKRHIQFSSSSFMLLIGSALVILSGIAFGVANWVRTTPTGRVSIIMAAAAASFGVSTLFRKVLKLERTSAAFYSVGTVFAATGLFTAGCYDLMGDWLSASGDGCAMLLALAAFTVSVLSLIGAKMYTHKALSYTGLLAASAGLICMAVQVVDKPYQAAAILIVLQAALTAAFHLFGTDMHFPDYLPVRNAADITAALYGGIALAYGLATINDPDLITFVVFITLIIQSVIYGVKYKSSVLHGFRTVLSLLTAFSAACAVNDVFSTENAVFLFGLMALIIVAADRLFPVIRTRFSTVLSLSAVLISGIINAYADNAMCIITGIISAVVLYAYSVYSKERISAGFFGLTVPLIPLILGFNCNNYLFRYDSISHLNFSLLFTAAFFIAVSFIINSVLKKKSLAVYSNMLVSAIMLVILAMDEKHIIPIIAVSAAHIIVSGRFKVNWTAIGSSAAIITALSILIDDIEFHDPRAYAIFYLAVFLLLLAASRLLHPNGIFYRSDNRISIDTIQLMAWIFILFDGSYFHYAGFVKTLALTAFLANFVRKNTDKNTAAVIYTISTIIAAFAFITRPFCFFSNDMIEFKINLAVIAAAGAAFSLIWKNRSSAVRVISSITYLIAYSGLILDAIRFHSAGNTIFVLSVDVAILLLSFFFRNKTWFTASSLSLIIITLWSSREYLMSLNWWAYLFIAGMILISAAAVNEYLKKKGKTIRSAVNDKFSGWVW